MFTETTTTWRPRTSGQWTHKNQASPTGWKALLWLPVHQELRETQAGQAGDRWAASDHCASHSALNPEGWVVPTACQGSALCHPLHHTRGHHQDLKLLGRG